MENPNSPEPKPIRTQRERAVAGMKMFIEASATCPASVIAQSALIASRCKKLGNNPAEFCEALLDDSELIQKIVRRANEAHGKKEKSWIPVDESSAAFVISSDFTHATAMLDLEEEDLRKIYVDKYETRNTSSIWKRRFKDFEAWMFEETQRLLLNRRTQPPTG